MTADSVGAVRGIHPSTPNATQGSPIFKRREEGALRLGGVRLLVIASALAYVAAFAWAYSSLIAPLWGYQGLVDAPRSGAILALANVMALMPSLFMPSAISRPSQVVLWILYLWAYVPGCVMPYYVLSAGTEFLPVTVTLAASFALLLAMQRIPRRELGFPLRMDLPYGVLIGSCALLAVTFVATTVGIRFELPSFAEVYDVRSEYLDVLSDATASAAYAVGWTGNVIGPFMIALGIGRKRYGFVFAGLGIQLFIYALTGLKSTVLVTPLIFGLSVLLTTRRLPRAGLLLIAGSAVLVLSIAAFESIAGQSALSSLFIRRLIAVPGWLFGLYAHFFTHNPTYELGHSVLSWLHEAPYDLNPQQLIAYVNYGRMSGANGGIWADGMANFGLIGVVGFTVLLGLVFLVMDGVAMGKPLRIVAPVFGAAGFSLVNSALLTSLLSHGIGFAMLLVWMLPRERTVAGTSPK